MPAPMAAIFTGAISRTESSKKRSCPGVWCWSDLSWRISDPGAARHGVMLAQDAAVAAPATARPQRRPDLLSPVSVDAALEIAATAMDRPARRTAARARDSCSRHLNPAKVPAPRAASTPATMRREFGPGLSWPLIRAASESTMASAEE